MTPTYGHVLLTEWALDPAILYLNHGTVGATPRRVLAAQQAIRDEIERQPSRFLLRELADVKQQPMPRRPRMRVAADAVADFLGARGDDLVFVDNATAGANAVLASLDLRAGDEIVVTDHGYGGVTTSARHWAGRAGATVRVVELPHPRFEPGAIISAVAAALSPRTRLAIIDHVTSGSALILPVAELIARCHAAGVPVLVDGAHAPGALPLDIPALGADWYTGNLHKWAMAPRSCGVLWASPERQSGLHPTVVSWGYDQGFAAEFDLTGTRDPSPWLAAPAGIEFLHRLELAAARAYQHALAWSAAQRLADRFGVTLPMEEAQVGTMVTLPLPARAGTTQEEAYALRLTLLQVDHIEVQLHAWRGSLWVRPSAQVYNEESDIVRLAAALEARM
jgi:isopenicillin-N epimerase